MQYYTSCVATTALLLLHYSNTKLISWGSMPPTPLVLKTYTCTHVYIRHLCNPLLKTMAMGLNLSIHLLVEIEGMNFASVMLVT